MSKTSSTSSIEKLDISEASTKEVVVSNTAWTEEEERALVRRLDFRIIPLITLFYLCNFIDRTNIGNARVAGLERDIRLEGYEYNIGLSVFFIFYALSEVPSNLILKHVGAQIWIPSLVVFFGLVCMCTAAITDFAGFMCVRVFLGIAEGGVMPGLAYYLSMWYTRDELVFRVGIFVSASSFSGAFGGLLASAFLSIPQLHGLPHGRWRNIFLIEGAITVIVGLMGYYFLPSSPEKNRFLSTREKEIAQGRILAENAGLVEEDKTDMRLVKRAVYSMNTWMCALGFLLVNITVQGVSLFLPSLLAGMGYGRIESQLRSVPPYVLAALFAIFVAYACQKTSRRGMWILISTPFSIIGSCMLIGSTNRAIQYAGMFFLAFGIFPLGTIFLTWGSNNAAPYTTRAVSSGMIVAIGTMGPIVTSWVYLPYDAPRYIIGLSVQLGSQVGIMIVTAFLMYWNIRENRIRLAGGRDHRLNADAHTVATLGNKHPKFVLKI